MASLSNQQADVYLDRIRLPSVYRQRLLEGPDGPRALAAVTALQQYHMAAVPFENLQLHYAPQHTFSIEPTAVFASVVRERRGGTCVQVHPLFAALLRRFGFMVTLTGARLNAGASIGAAASMDKTKVQYGGLIHLATLVTIHGQRHLVDTAMGPAASPTPVPLIHDQPETDVGHRQRRLLYTTLPDTIDPSATDKWWRLQIRELNLPLSLPSSSSDWQDVCCFTEMAWRPLDFAIMLGGMDQLSLGWFKSRVACYRLLLDEGEDENEKGGQPVGYLLLLHDEVRRCYKGTLSVVRKLYNEQDRVQALRELFDVAISVEQQRCIMGTEAELRDDYDFYG